MIAYPDTSFLCAFYLKQSNSQAAAGQAAAMKEPLQVTELLAYEFRQSLRFQVWRHAANPREGVALADVVNLLSPRLVVLGGPLFRQAPQLISEPLMRVVRQRALERSANEIQIEVSNLGSEAAALGAARVICEKVLEEVYQERR